MTVIISVQDCRPFPGMGWFWRQDVRALLPARHSLNEAVSIPVTFSTLGLDGAVAAVTSGVQSLVTVKEVQGEMPRVCKMVLSARI
jgi:hypothetical protein